MPLLGISLHSLRRKGETGDLEKRRTIRLALPPSPTGTFALAALRLIHLRIGLSKDLLGCLIQLWGPVRASNGERYREWDQLVCLITLRYRSLDALHDHLCLPIGLDENNQELIPTVADNKIRVSHLLNEKLRHRLQDSVAGLMAVGIVDLLEAIDVDHQEADRMVVPLGPADLTLDNLVKVTAVVDVGQRIAHRLITQLALQPDPLYRLRSMAEEELK